MRVYVVTGVSSRLTASIAPHPRPRNDSGRSARTRTELGRILRPVKPLIDHSWNLTIKEAKELQIVLSAQVCRENRLAGPPRYIAGVDISGALGDGETLGAVVVLSYPGLALIEVRTARKRPPMPYIPGLLSFRETPVLIDTLAQLTTTPDLLIVDGHGIAHPRRFGIACHLGILFDVPTIGCAKSILVGEHRSIRKRRRSTAPLQHKGETVGLAVRTREAVKPVYVSIGHNVDLAAAAMWVLACAKRYRLPEPTRLAHEAASGRLEVGLRGCEGALKVG